MLQLKYIRLVLDSTENRDVWEVDIRRCRNPGSNQGPLDLQSNALPTELFRLVELK